MNGLDQLLGRAPFLEVELEPFQGRLGFRSRPLERFIATAGQARRGCTAYLNSEVPGDLPAVDDSPTIPPLAFTETYFECHDILLFSFLNLTLLNAGEPREP
ncbi:MAG TPA: hypothetical protein VHD32_00860 [Candidatus Didemnitutus sp.]|nr:hypothetical protein [Candidatus Didemnitutus sp.]